MSQLGQACNRRARGRLGVAQAVVDGLEGRRPAFVIKPAVYPSPAGGRPYV
jgi:hypothetical protein